MEVSAVAQRWATQQLNRQAEESSLGGSFAEILSMSKRYGASLDQSGSSGDASLAVSLLSGMLSSHEDADQSGLSSSLIMMCMMMGCNANLSGSSMGVMMSSLAGAMNGNTLSATDINELSGSSLVNSYLPTYAYGLLDTDTNLYNNTYVYNPKATTNIPASASVAANPTITSNAYNRSAARYRQVINQFDVENNTRYAVKNGSTYCNIFVWDVTRAMGAEIPHYIDKQTMEARYYPETKGAFQTNANMICKWLSQKGNEYGWCEVTAEQAQALANEGHPVVTTYKNPNGHGHVQVVCPSKDGTYNEKKGVTVAQAGSHLYDYAYISDVFSSRGLSKVVYYAHV